MWWSVGKGRRCGVNVLSRELFGTRAVLDFGLNLYRFLLTFWTHYRELI